jgi:hypothetical protein
MNDYITETISKVIQGREQAYTEPERIKNCLVRLIDYAITNRDDCDIHPDELDASILIASSVIKLGLVADVKVGHTIWKLISEDSQAQWLYPPENIDGIYINLINVANNMATNQCHIDFS